MKIKVKDWKKIKIICILITLILITVLGTIIFFSFNSNNTKETHSELALKNENIPEVTLENTQFEISETNLTAENIIIDISSKLENYNLYYFIEPLDNIDEENKETNYILYKEKIEIEFNSNIYFKYELDGIYSENPYKLEINNIQKEVVENEKATEEELKKEKVSKKDNLAPYYIIVNYSSNVVTIYAKDEKSEYTVPVKAMICSTGISTPKSGVYKLPGARAKWGALFGGVYGQYTVKIVGNILFHSVPYLRRDNSTLEYWEYDKLGTKASAGCIRLTVQDALWIYNNCGSGTQVEFSSNAPNPLGKPTARKISSYEDLRGYDPTDPDTNNPWKNFVNKSEETTIVKEDSTDDKYIEDKVETETQLPDSETSDLEDVLNSTDKDITKEEKEDKEDNIQSKEEDEKKENTEDSIIKEENENIDDSVIQEKE